MVSELYWRIREILAHATAPGGELRPNAVDELALTIYLVAVAEAQPETDLLSDLRRTLQERLPLGQAAKSDQEES
jgi:hypothetical protein